MTTTQILGMTAGARQADDPEAVPGSCVIASLDAAAPPSNDEASAAGSAALAVGHALATVRETDLCVVGEPTPLDPPDPHREECVVAARNVAHGGRRIDELAAASEATAIVTRRDPRPGVIDELLSEPGGGLARSAETDVLTVGPEDELDSIASVLVPVAAGPHTPVAIEAGCAIARAYDAAIDLFHVATTEAAIEAGEELLAEHKFRCVKGPLADRCGGEDLDLDTWLYEADAVGPAIVEQSSYYDAIVMGAPRLGRLERAIFGSTARNVRQSADAPVWVAHSRPRE